MTTRTIKVIAIWAVAALVAVGTPLAMARIINPSASSGGSSLATPVTPANGGTGVANNAASTLTISGAFATTLTVTNTTGVTLPTSGTLLSALTQGSLTKGNFLVGNDAGTAQATSSIFVDSTGRIGIASTTPQRALSVVGAVAVQEATLTDAATVVWDLASSSYAVVNLTASRTLQIQHATQAIGQSVRLTVCANGAWSLTWDQLIMWPGGTAPTQTAAANHCDVYSGFVTNASSTPKIFLGSVLNF